MPAWIGGVYLGRGVRAGQGVWVVSWKILGGGSIFSWARMSRWALVSSVRWRKVPAGPGEGARGVLFRARGARGPGGGGGGSGGRGGGGGGQRKKAWGRGRASLRWWTGGRAGSVF